LQGDSTDYVDDARLAATTKMIVEDVRNWLETLEGKNRKGCQTWLCVMNRSD
jgi:hypothetical protein